MVVLLCSVNALGFLEWFKVADEIGCLCTIILQHLIIIAIIINNIRLDHQPSQILRLGFFLFPLHFQPLPLEVSWSLLSSKYRH